MFFTRSLGRGVEVAVQKSSQQVDAGGHIDAHKEEYLPIEMDIFDYILGEDHIVRGFTEI